MYTSPFTKIDPKYCIFSYICRFFSWNWSVLFSIIIIIVSLFMCSPPRPPFCALFLTFIYELIVCCAVDSSRVSFYHVPFTMGCTPICIFPLCNNMDMMMMIISLDWFREENGFLLHLQCCGAAGDAVHGSGQVWKWRSNQGRRRMKNLIKAVFS